MLGILLLIVDVFAYGYHIDGNTEPQLNDCWVGWKKYHYGATTVRAKKGQSFVFSGSPYITRLDNGGTEIHPGTPYTATTRGYGYYSLEFSKHVLGLLSYIKNNLGSVGNYKTNYIPTENSTLVEYNANEDRTVNLEDAINIIMNGMITNWYSLAYENGEFTKFWDGTFIVSQENKLKNIQNKFYWKAYGENAFNKLVRMMNVYGNGYYGSLTSNQQKALQGVVFSIMEARYRNKNVQGKMNLEIKAAEGELWPFLVYLENLNHISYDKNTRKYIDNGHHDTYYDFPDFDKLIEGAYQWMVYYEADTVRTISYRTITTIINENSDEEEDVEINCEDEFCELTWDYLPTLSGNELEDFYNRRQKVRSLFKKSSENTQGVFGAEEIYDITSDINFSEAMRDMKTAMIEFCGGNTMDSVWTGLTDYNIERTYLMAKNIVETNRVQDEYAYYNIETNILTYTYGRSGKEYLLMDFQKVILAEPLKDEDDNWTNIDTDGDDLLDRNELGDDTDNDDYSVLYSKVDITKFIKKAVEKELYGNDSEAIHEHADIIKNVMDTVKYNVYRERRQFLLDHSSDNVCDRREDKEHYLNIDEPTERILNTKATDAEKISYIKYNNSKLEVKLFKYSSNPVLKDTDFDGLDDNEDKVPKDNHFTGRMNSTRLSGSNGIEVDMNMDYRYFFLSNKLYYDELSTMSLLYANSIYRKGDNQTIHSGLQLRSANNFVNVNESFTINGVQSMNIGKFKNLPVKEMMEHFGFKNVRTYYMGSPGDEGDENSDHFASFRNSSTGTMDIPTSEIDISYKKIGTKYRDVDEIYLGYKDTHKGRVSIGYRTIEYHGIYKTVIGVVIRGTAEDDDWDSDFDMGDIRIKELIDKNQLSNSKLNELGYDTQYRTELNHFIDGYNKWTHIQHHAGFDIVANRIFEVLNDYYKEFSGNFSADIETYDENTIVTAITANSVSNYSNDVVDGGVCFWITGHSMGAGVANLVAANLIDKGHRDNVYCYTFAAPNTFYRTDNREDNYKEPHGVNYRCIFNIVNEDDFVPEVPMSLCNWTKYGRTAKLSFNSNKSNIDTIIRNESKYSTIHYDWTNTKRFINEHYNGNTKTIEDIVSSFNSIFENNYDDMRYDAYTFNSDEYIQISKAPSAEWVIPNNTKPYQKIYATNSYNLDYQMPAYFMQYLSFAMHGAFHSVGFWEAKFNKAYISAKDNIVRNKELIQEPHFLENCYLLTKKLVVLILIRQG